MARRSDKEKMLLAGMEYFAQGIALIARAGGLNETAFSDLKVDTEIPRAAFDPNEAAEYIGVGRTTLFGLRKSGDIPCVRIGAKPKFLRKDLDEYLEGLRKPRTK